MKMTRRDFLNVSTAAARSSHAAHIAADRTIGGAGIRERET